VTEFTRFDLARFCPFFADIENFVCRFFFFLFNIAGRCSGYKELGKGCDSRPVWSFRGDLDIAHIPAGRWRVFFGGRDAIWSGVRGISWLGASGVSGRRKS